MASVQSIEAVVAAGRTLYLPVEPTLVESSDGKKTLFPGRPTTVAAGKSVRLPVDEVKRLRGLGFLVDPDAEEVESGNGPNFTSSDGPAVKAA